MTSPSIPNQASIYDAIVVGAGIAGMFQLYRLREMGLHVLGIEAGSDVGGTWYWNRYPGARLDSQSEVYQYWFSEELYKEWMVSERFSAQPEVEAWLHFVADRLDLRKDYEFNTLVASATYLEDSRRWAVTTNNGKSFNAQFFITCCGMLSAPLSDLFPGQSSFKGHLFHTARWPKEPIDFGGKRVGVVGNGATGIQVIQTLAAEVAHLKVFIRTPQYTIAMRNPKYEDADRTDFGDRFRELRDKVQSTFGGLHYDFDNGSWYDASPEERGAVYERLWREGSLQMWLGSYPEIFTDLAASEEISNFVREKLRAQLNYDPQLCKLLVPTNYGFGTHRVPLENGYLKAFLRGNVEAVDVKSAPIVSVVPEGLKTADGKVHQLDILILATGFDAGTGALTRIDIQGKGGRKLKEDWGKEIRTTMGLQVHGYPNLFTVGAPLAPAAALCNMTTCLQQQAGWIADAIGYLRDNGLKVLQPTAEREAAWVRHHDEVADATLLSKTDSWYMGSNVPGKPRRLISYAGGVGAYKLACDAVKASGYDGFEMA